MHPKVMDERVKLEAELLVELRESGLAGEALQQEAKLLKVEYEEELARSANKRTWGSHTPRVL